MDEAIWEKLQKVAKVLHWLGKYEEARAVSATARLMRDRDIRELPDWERFVEAME